jgi:hypothetical protein
MIIEIQGQIEGLGYYVGLYIFLGAGTQPCAKRITCLSFPTVRMSRACLGKMIILSTQVAKHFTGAGRQL